MLLHQLPLHLVSLQQSRCVHCQRCLVARAKKEQLAAAEGLGGGIFVTSKQILDFLLKKARRESKSHLRVNNKKMKFS